jgi:hypothetical protein
MSPIAARLSSISLDVSLLALFVAMILWVVFGQVSVRKLRKNPETKDHLGVELYSGWDIINVAHALSWPSSFLRRVGNGPLSFVRADPNLLYRNTTKLDRFLGRTFYWSMVAFVLAIFISMLFSWLS